MFRPLQAGANSRRVDFIEYFLCDSPNVDVALTWNADKQKAPRDSRSKALVLFSNIGCGSTPCVLFANYNKVGAINQKSTQTTNFINVIGPIITNFEVHVLDAAVRYRQIPDNTLRSLDYLPARSWMASDHVSERLTYTPY